ncbi:984_t:CDS:1, partial [Gigaspora margarita]
SIFPSPSDTSNSNASSPDASKENTSNTNFVSPILPENDSGNNDNSTAKYIIIGVSGFVGIVLLVSILVIFKKLRANRHLKHKNNNNGNSRGFDTGFGNGNSNGLRNISHSSQQGTTSYKDGPIQSYNASYGSGLYPTRNPYLVGSDYSGRSNSSSSPTDSNYHGYNGNNFQGYHVQNYNSQLSPPPNQYYNSDMNIVTHNFLPVGGIDRRMIRENLMEIANEEDRTQENVGNYNIPENTTLSLPSEKDSEQESFRLSHLNENSRNSRTSSPGDNKSQTSQRPIYF